MAMSGESFRDGTLDNQGERIFEENKVVAGFVEKKVCSQPK